MRSFFLTRAVLVMALSSPLATMADVLQMPEQTAPAATSMAMPEKGMRMDQVKAQFGKPREVLSPVGKPPITRWVYDGYTVYFEYSYVINSVENR